jgi:hypothetical protein
LPETKKCGNAAGHRPKTKSTRGCGITSADLMRSRATR